MEDIRLIEYMPKSMLVVNNKEVRTSCVPACDVHTHLRESDPKKGICDFTLLLWQMEENGVKHMVDLDGLFGAELDKSMRLKEGYEDSITTFSTVDFSRVDDGDFESKTRKEIQRAHGLGVKGLKFLKSLGLEFKWADGTYIRPDDRRIQVIWQTAGELKMPVLIHIADPKAFFEPLDRYNERIEELAGNPTWHFGKEEYYRFDEMMQMQENLLADNPNTKFILAHTGNCAEDLGFVSDLLDRHPNAYVDIAARIQEMGRQPYTAREFLIKHQDRVLFGTDTLLSAGNMKNSFDNHHYYYEFLETYNEFFPANAHEQQGRWNIYGVGLPKDVLQKIYWDNVMGCLSGK